LTRIENGTLKDLSFLKNGKVTGGEGVNDELGVLALNGNGHVVLEGFADDCLTDPARCPNGFTLSFWLKHGGIFSLFCLQKKFKFIIVNILVIHYFFMLHNIL
jgi:hypothetical protein